jgi:hypothetical protein
MAKNTFSVVRGVRVSLPGSPKNIRDGRLEIFLSLVNMISYTMSREFS